MPAGTEARRVGREDHDDAGLARSPRRRDAAALAGLAAASGVHITVGLDHGLTASGHGAALVAAGAAQLALVFAVSWRFTAGRRRLTALFAIAMTLAWIASRLVGDDPVGVLDAATAAVHAGAAGLLLSSGRSRSLVRPTSIAMLVLAALPVGLVIGGVVPSGHHHHPPVASSTATTPTDPPIFGDLFAGHGDHASEEDLHADTDDALRGDGESHDHPDHDH